MSNSERKNHVCCLSVFSPVSCLNHTEKLSTMGIQLFLLSVEAVSIVSGLTFFGKLQTITFNCPNFPCSSYADICNCEPLVSLLPIRCNKLAGSGQVILWIGCNEGSSIWTTILLVPFHIVKRRF